ncbi:putative leucine-rich repeat receptor-like serine/threonine-protein kinase At2g24130 [Eucalyptus grandis]|uniref:putative leucine-rich repeat receptor-like serine/threonine-protein kinase At2g24130 n=1 Tax=Eucalyptus grandis TaxID=71139 RepID=UPI00192F08B7|nr:putative leucine-rich repeat receptor-like serine/threonine-protein kinase At2g24130 [Eucalyptus grandis]
MPKFIGSMKKLRYLDLSHSFDFAIVPHEWGNLTELEVLDLHGYYRVGAIDDFQWLSHLQALKYLDMSGIHVNKSRDFMQVISALPSLSHLSLSHCGLCNFHLSFDCLANSTALHLEYLDLSMNSLGGPIPSIPFQNMTSLEYLDLSMNSLGGPIPSIPFQNMTSLEFLDLSWNSLGGPIPSIPFQNMTSLEFLDLSGNSLGGPIPSIPFQNMTSLRHLYLFSNSFISSVPRWFNNLRSLIDLNLANNFLQSIEGGLFSFLREQPFLESLCLDDNKLHEEIFSVEGSSSGPIGENFKQLRISNNFLQGTLPDWLFHLKNLTVLDLSYNQLHGTIPSPYDWLCLRVLRLSSNQFTGNIPDAFGRLQVLSILDLSNNLLNGTIPHSLGQLQYLFSLDLSANSLRGTISEIHFSNFSKLRLLDTSNNHLAIKVDSDWIPPFNLRLQGGIPVTIKYCRNLKILDLGENKISGSVPHWIGPCFPLLQILRLRENMFNGSIPSQLCLLSALQILDMAVNNLTGTIPNCLGHMKGMKLNKSIDEGNSLSPTDASTTVPNPPPADTDWTQEHVEQVVKGMDLDYTTLDLKLMESLPCSPDCEA